MFEHSKRSLLVRLAIFDDGEFRDVFPSVSVGGCLTSGPPNLCTVFVYGNRVESDRVYATLQVEKSGRGGDERFPNHVAGVF